MTIPEIHTVALTRADGPVLVVGPSLGTSVTALWETVADRLPGYRVIGWDLPGHGVAPAPGAPFAMAELAAGVLAAVDKEIGSAVRWSYAGVSVGGAVGLQLLLDAPDRLAAAALVCTGARIGEPDGWTGRAERVAAEGIDSMVDGARERWFAPGFVDRNPLRAQALLDALRGTDVDGYRFVCGALAGFDVRDRLSEISTPVLAIAGRDDLPTPPASLETIASGVVDGRLEVLDGVAHLAPAEDPETVARLLDGFLSAADRHPGTAAAPITDATTIGQQRAAGMVVRREVLGDAHVDRATAAATGFTTEFQEMITQYAWGGIWTRPGLDRRARSLITLTALVARGHHDELAMHVRSAIGNGLTPDELKEVFLQTAIYCGVPDANIAFRVAQKVLMDIGIDLG